MPERALSHQIEAESRRAFENLLGNLFVFREENPDYGIDGTVEEFGSDRKATGLRYYAQLKSTAEEDLRKALKTSIQTETATMYGALDLPLLMVLYHSPSQGLYVRWWHGRLSSRRSPKPDAASITFRWVEDDLASSSAPTRWASEARAFLDLRSASPSLPLRINIDLKQPPTGLTAAEVEMAAKAQMRNRRDVVDFQRENAEITIRVQGSLLAIDMPGMTAASYDLGNEYPAGDATQLGIDVMALLAVAFVRWGQADLAARMTSSFYARSTLAGNPDIAMMLASAMTRARRLPEALAVADDIDQKFGLVTPNTSFFFTLTSRQHSRSLTREEARRYEKVMRRRIRRRERGKLGIEASREMVSLASHFRGKQEPTPAIQLLERAAELDPGYRERGYYWHELGGVLFLGDRFQDSADAYQRAGDLGEAGFTPLLRADALLFAGQYEESRRAFREVLTGEEDLVSGSEYYLKLLLLDILTDWFDLVAQDRDGLSATKKCRPCRGEPRGRRQ